MVVKTPFTSWWICEHENIKLMSVFKHRTKLNVWFYENSDNYTSEAFAFRPTSWRCFDVESQKCLSIRLNECLKLKSFAVLNTTSAFFSLRVRNAWWAHSMRSIWIQLLNRDKQRKPMTRWRWKKIARKCWTLNSDSHHMFGTATPTLIPLNKYANAISSSRSNESK